MKTLLFALIASSFGAFVHYELTDEPASKPAPVREVRESMEDKAWRQMEESYYEKCRSRWTRKTGCFHAPRVKARHCLALLEHKCGFPDAPKKE